jgi:hypothetical protein
VAPDAPGSRGIRVDEVHVETVARGQQLGRARADALQDADATGTCADDRDGRRHGAPLETDGTGGPGAGAVAMDVAGVIA